MKSKLEKTNAVRLLEQHKSVYRLYTYDDSIVLSGSEIADILHEPHEKVFKTLVTIGKSGNHYVYMVPVDSELDLKKAAKCAGEKSIDMIKSKELLPLTGYIHGGCSPIGMKKVFRTFIHITAKDFKTITFSGGRVGLQIETELSELQKTVKIELSDIIV